MRVDLSWKIRHYKHFSLLVDETGGLRKGCRSETETFGQDAFVELFKTKSENGFGSRLLRQGAIDLYRAAALWLGHRLKLDLAVHFT